jgi:hypothetical protein
MARPWTQCLRDWYQRSSTSELTAVAARRLSADLAAVAARSGIIDVPRAVTGPPASRPVPTPDTTATSVPAPVVPARFEATPTESAHRDPDEPVSPAVAPMGAKDTSAEVDDPPPPVIPLLLRRPETSEAHDGTPQATTTVEPEQTGERNGRVDRDDPGRWLPLRDALRAVGSLEQLYQLARDGKLQPRAEADGQVDVWVSDRECFGGAPTRFLDATRHADPLVSECSTFSEDGHQVAALIAPLVESHERHLELARENGALGERVARLQRQLEELTGRPAD